MGRYRFVRLLRDRAWLAEDMRSGREVVVGLVGQREAECFEKMKGLEDRHLASILSVHTTVAENERPAGVLAGEAAVVSELVRGKALSLLLGDRTALPHARAVAWVLRIARSLHRASEPEVAHGAISPAAIVVQGPGHPVAPVLSFFRSPALGLALSPEVLSGAEPTPADDVWSLGVCLYAALTGHYPFPGATADAVRRATRQRPAPLVRYGVDEPVLQRLLSELLAPDPAHRLRSLSELVDALDAFELQNPLPSREATSGARPFSRGPLARPTAQQNSPTLSGVVFDTAAAETPDLDALREPPARETPPPPEAAPPRAAAPLRGPVDSALPSAPEVARPSEPRVSRPISLTPPAHHPFQKKGVRWPLVAAVAGLAFAAYYFVLGPGAELTRGKAAEPQATVVAEPAASAHKATPTARKRTKEEKLDACVRSFFEDDQFTADADFAFVCQDGPLYSVGRQLHELAEAKNDARDGAPDAPSAAAPKTVGKGANVDVVRAERNRRPLGWYELLASAIVRRSCCQPAPPVELPKTAGWCDQLDDVVDNLAEDSARSGDLAPRVKRFDRAVDCLYAGRIEIPYPDYATRPLDEAQRSALQRFLSHAAVSEAKRRMLE